LAVIAIIFLLVAIIVYNLYRLRHEIDIVILMIVIFVECNDHKCYVIS